MTEPEILEYMSRVPLFRELQAEGLERITSRVGHRRVESDTDIVHIGDPGRALYVIVEGEVDVVYPARSTEFKLARLGPGECFGEMAILNDMPSSATVSGSYQMSPFMAAFVNIP